MITFDEFKTVFDFINKEQVDTNQNEDELKEEYSLYEQNMILSTSTHKYGWVYDFTEDEIFCNLRKDYELDDDLTLGRGLLTKQQDEMVCMGAIIKYNKIDKTIEFSLPDGINWC